MTRLLGVINLIFALLLLVLVLSGVFSHVLVEISSWNQFEGLVAKVVIGIASVLAICSAVYIAFGKRERIQPR